MRRKKFSSKIKALPAEKKVIAMASLVVLVSCFLPWYGINSRVINEWWSAFGSIGSVAGYIVATFAIASLAIILLPQIKPGFSFANKLPWEESSILFFLSAQSLFVTAIFIPVYAQYSLINATSSGTRFGIYLALAGTLIASIVALAYHRRVAKESSRAEFASVPRTHRDIEDWSEETEDTQEVLEDTEEIMEDSQATIDSFEEEVEEEPVQPVQPVQSAVADEAGEEPIAQENMFSNLSEEDIRRVSSVSADQTEGNQY